MRKSFQSRRSRVLCCPEDKVCARGEACGPKTLCPQCQFPLCRACQRSPGGKYLQMPAGSLANDLMVFYAPRELYVEEMTVIEMM